MIHTWVKNMSETSPVLFLKPNLVLSRDDSPLVMNTTRRTAVVTASHTASQMSCSLEGWGGGFCWWTRSSFSIVTFDLRVDSGAVFIVKHVIYTNLSPRGVRAVPDLDRHRAEV